MPEITLEAEVGRPMGSSATRRLRARGRSPASSTATAPTRSRWRSSAGTLRIALSGESGANTLLSLKAGDADLPDPGPGHAAPPGAGHGHPRRLPDRPARRDHRRRGPHHPRRRGPRGPPRRRPGRPAAVQPAGAAQPGRHPHGDRGRRDRAHHRRRRSGWATSSCRPGSPPTSRTTWPSSSASRPGSRPLEEGGRGRGGRGRRGRRPRAPPPSRRRGLGPASPARRPGRATRPGRGTPADLLVVGLAQPGRGVRRHPPQRGRPTSWRCWPRATARRLRGRKGQQAVGGRGPHRRAPGGPGRPHHLHERVGCGRAPAGAPLRHRGPLQAGRSSTTSWTCRPGACGSRSAGARPATTACNPSRPTSTAPTSSRVRIGIGKPPGRQAGADYVLRAPGRDRAREMLDVASSGRPTPSSAGREGLEAAMNRYNGAG